MAYTDLETRVLATQADIMDIAEGAYAVSRGDLTTLAGLISTPGVTMPDVTIGTSATVTWSAWVDPVEPNYAGEMPTVPTVPAVVTPDGVQDPDALVWELVDGTPPTDLSTQTLSAIPALGTLPTITAVSPTMDVALLESEFVFADDAYVERVTPDVREALLRVLGGDLGLPQSYWTSLWTEAAGDLARLQAAKARASRNRGVASMWPLPGAAVLAAAREVSDEALRSLQMDRLKKAHEQAVMASDDFWKAIGQGLAYEATFIGLQQQVAARALTAAEQTNAVRVQVHNANVTRFNALLAAAQADGTIQDLQVARVLRGHAAGLSAAGAEIEQAKERIAEYQARYAGYQIDRTEQITRMGAQVQWWGGQIDAHAKYQALAQQGAQTEVQAFAAQASAIDAVAKGTAAILSARTGAAQAQTAHETAVNAAELDRARITQAAQEALARVETAQWQFQAGQNINVYSEIAKLTVGYAQSTMAAANVNLGVGGSINLSGAA